MAYIPVPTTQKVCKQCNTLYYAKDRRRLYCSSSCNTLAWMARKGLQETRRPITKGNLPFTFQNVAVTAAGATAAAVGNYVLNDAPARKEVIAMLTRLDKQIGQGLNQILAAAQYQVDFINAMKQLQPTLEHNMREAKRQRIEMAREG